MGTSSNQTDAAIEEIHRIAARVVGPAADKAQGHASTFGSKHTPPSDFSSYPLAEQLGVQHRAALETFQAAVDGLVSDLQDFQHHLTQSAKTYQDTDDGAAAAMTAVNAVYGATHTWHSDHSWTSEHDSRGGHLDMVDGATRHQATIEPSKTGHHDGSVAGGDKTSTIH